MLTRLTRAITFVCTLTAASALAQAPTSPIQTGGSRIYGGSLDKGPYSSSTTYGYGDIVYYGTILYYSRQANNTGQTPASGSQWWGIQPYASPAPGLLTNGVYNSLQDTLNLQQGTGVALSNANGVTTINVTGSSIALQHNGTVNGSQTKLNLVPGTGIGIADDGSGDLTLTSTASGGGAVGYTDTGSSLSTGISACSATNGIQVSQGVTVSSNATIPSTCALKFVPGGELLPSSGVTVTINGGVQAGKFQQIFGGAGSIAGLTGDIPAGWFGAFPVSTLAASASNENTAHLQAAINAVYSGTVALDAGYYGMQTCGLQITRGNVGISGLSGGYSYPSGTSLASVLTCNSPSAEILDVAGTGPAPTQTIVWNVFHDFTLQRTVAPTGTAKGFSCNFAGGVQADRIYSEDSVYDYYMHACPSDGLGHWANISGGWGFASVAASSYSSSQTLEGIFLDSYDGNAENTIILDNASIGGQVGFPASTDGMLIQGTSINDVDAKLFSSAVTTNGIRINYTGPTTNNGQAYDLHFENATLDNCFGVCLSVSNIPINGSVVFTDLYATSNNASQQAVYLYDSYNVEINGAEIADIKAGGGIGVASGGNNTLSNIQEEVILGGTGLTLAASTNNIVSNFQTVSVSGTPQASFIQLINGSTGNQLTNIVATGSTSGTGISADSGSTGNGLCGVGSSITLSGISTTCSGSSSSSSGAANTIVAGTAGTTFSSSSTNSGTFPQSSGFTSAEIVAGSSSSGLVWEYNPTLNGGTGIIASITPGTAWRDLLLQPYGQHVGIGLKGQAFANSSILLQIGTYGTADANAATMLSPTATTQKVLVLQGVPSQTGNLQEWQTSGGTATWWVGSDGIMRTKDTSTGKTCVLNVTGGTLTPTCN